MEMNMDEDDIWNLEADITDADLTVDPDTGLVEDEGFDPDKFTRDMKEADE